MELLTMTCRNCGGKLSISKESDQCICMHCGTEYLVTFNDGAISIKILSEAIQGIRKSTDKTAAELGLARLLGERKIIYERYHLHLIEWNLASRWRDKYHREIYEILGKPIEIEKFDVSRLKKLHECCKKGIEFEQQRIFPDKYYLTEFNKYINWIEECTPELVKIIEQEEYYRKVITP